MVAHVFETVHQWLQRSVTALMLTASEGPLPLGRKASPGALCNPSWSRPQGRSPKPRSKNAASKSKTWYAHSPFPCLQRTASVFLLFVAGTVLSERSYEDEAMASTHHFSKTLLLLPITFQTEWRLSTSTSLPPPPKKQNRHRVGLGEKSTF